MAARDTGFGAVETLLHHGKLLSLELLVRVLENPLHNWNNVRPEVHTELHTPPNSWCTSWRLLLTEFDRNSSVL